MRSGILLLAMVITFVSGIFPQTATLEPTLEMRTINGISIPFQNGMPLPGFEKQNRSILNLKGEWKKSRFTANHDYTLAKRDAFGYNNIVTEANGRNQLEYSDSSWLTKNLPSVENQMRTYPTVPEYYEDGVWYRYKFNVDNNLTSVFTKLVFYASNYVTDVWLNGHYIGYHEGGYTPFTFDVSNFLNYSGSNTISIRVDNPKWGTRNDIIPYVVADWFNYAGVIHDMYLEFSNPVSIMRTDVTPLNINGDIQSSVVLYNKDTADKTVDIEIKVYNTSINESNIRSEKASDLISSEAAITGETQKSVTIKKDSAFVFKTNININNPKLWSPQNPNLYVMKVSLTENGVIKDEYFTQFGIRTIKTDGYKVLLNGQPVFFTGVARHEDHPLYGRSIPIDTIYSDLLKAKSLNVNMIRTGHYPNHLQTYLLTDRLGFAVMEEIPVWWFDDAASWSIQNSTRHIHQQMFREMVHRDYNRPSILLWSTSNECADVSGRATFEQTLKSDQIANYNDGRLISQSAAADKPGYQDASQIFCDVMGWTMYFGIFHGSTYYAGTLNFLSNAHNTRPTKPILDTEFGYWSSEDGSTKAIQTTVFTETFKAFKATAMMNIDGTLNNFGYLMGATWWCIFDWYSAGHPVGYQSMGLMDMNRTVSKPVASTLKNTYLPYFAKGGLVTSLEETVNLPVDYNLGQNYPNPFNPETSIDFSVRVRGNVSLKVFDILGREIAELLNKEYDAGHYSIKLNTSEYHLSSGVYLYRLSVNGFSDSKKMILLK